MATYLVTGASGYIGARLVKHLVQRGDKVVVMYRDAARLDILSDVKEKIILLDVAAAPADYRTAIQRHNVEAVFHLASKVSYACEIQDVAGMIDANVTFGTHILEAMCGTDCHRFINAATYWQHFDGSAYNPICLYAATKQAFMDIVTYYTRWRDLRAVSLKITDSYGDNDPRPKIFSLLDKAAATGETLKLTKGEQLMSFVHVDDIVSALCVAADRTAQMKASHVTYGVADTLISLQDAIALYLHVKSKKAHIDWGGSPYKATQIMKAWTDDVLPGWKPTIPLQDGLRSL